MNIFFRIIGLYIKSLCDYAVFVESGVEFATVDIFNDCIESGGSITVSASGGDTYQWSGPSGFSSSEAVVTIFNIGTYTVTISGGNEDCPDIAIYDVLITECSTLPVELVQFGANCTERGVIISWITASEINNDYFVLERSGDLKKFTEVAKIQGAGFSSSNIYYSISDLPIPEGDIYYRLRQVDFDGTTQVSDIIFVNCKEYFEGKPDIKVYPNPFNNELNILLENFKDNTVFIEIFDETGKLLIKEKINIYNPVMLHKIDLNHLKPSVYMLRIISEKHLFNNKIIKQ